jgi:hypothetical protein
MSINSIKQINRNAFNEKLIHRYLFERYYFSNILRKSLLPEKYKKLKINLISPEEDQRGEKYRADLTIYFKGKDKGVPVEVKWSVNNFNQENQINFLKNNNGFLVSFDDINSEFYKGVNYIKINHDDFMDWVSKNISKLTRESLIYRTSALNVSSGNQFWIVFLRGTAHGNFKKMIKDFPNNSFWAFRQNPRALRNIFDIQKGDSCLFILGYAKEGMGMSNKSNLSFELSSWYETRIKNPYYMVLKGDKGTFFEKNENIPINERRWPYFMDFQIINKFESKKRINLGKRGEFAGPFADSYNYGHGTPAPILRRQWDQLIDLIRIKKG